jgi:hypothetical protein
LKFGEFRKKGNINKYKGATSNDSSEALDKDYIPKRTTRAVSDKFA